ncbi:TonB-dependent receptor [Desulfosarcina variabilis str. Montpellier]|uniref:TonB-dependent receptor plug domain-containing protein n=1 Tax=Desulfosarcina variabilis TaxID=2300 RepID=UPI003AFB5BE3
MKSKLGVTCRFGFALALLMALSPLTPQVYAEDDKGYEEYSLGEIVVSGKGASVRDIAISDEVTVEDFEAVNAESVADALTYVPGVQVTYGRKAFPSISLHGFDQNRILTLIDGVPYYETKYGGMDLNQIGLESVARIDVVKGAPSVLYGANALGGVVNIITKKPTETPYLSATGEYGIAGMDDAYKASLAHGMKVGNFNYWLSYAHREWDSWDLSDDFEPRVGEIVRRPGGTEETIIEDGDERLNSDYKTDNFWAKVGVEPSEDTEVYLNFHYITTEKGDPANLDSIRVFSDFSHFDRITAYDDWGLDLSADHAFTDRFNLQAKLFYHDHNDDYASYSDQTYTEQIALSTYKDYILGGMLLGEYQMVDWNTLRAALHYKKDSHEQRDIEDLPFAESQAYTGSASLENETRLVDDKLSLVAGISYDWFDISKAEDDPETDGNIIENDTPDMTDAFNPMIGATYQLVDSVQLFASVAKKTRFPTLSQIYSGDEPNLELDPETAINYTAGVAYAYESLFKLQVAPFFHDISDYITRDVPPTENPYSQYKNYDEVEMLGFEVSAEVRPFTDLSFKIGYMNNNATNKSDGRVTDEVAKVPEHTLNVGIQYTLPVIRTRLNVNMLYVGESYYQLPNPDDPDLETIENDDYTLFNAKITQPFLSDRLETFVAVDNIFDEDYEPTSGYPAPGMRAWLGLTFRM